MRTRTGVVMTVVVLVVAGCGGDDATVTTTAASPAGGMTTTTFASGSPDTTAASSGDAIGVDDVIEVIEDAKVGEVRGVVVRVPLDQTVSYAGFDVTVDEVVIGFDPAGFLVAQVNVRLLNRSADREQLATAVEIESGGVVVGVDRDATPPVDAGGEGTGHFSLRLDPSFSLDDAILFIGRADRNRTQIPLGSTGELVTRTAIVLEDTSAAADPISTVTLERAVVSWDTAMPRSQSEPGSVFVRIEYSLLSSVATALNGDVITLRTLSGTRLSPITNSIDQVDADVRADGLFAVFLVDDPASGDYELIYNERFGKSTVEVPLTIP